MTSVSLTCNYIVHHFRRVLTTLFLGILCFGGLSGCGEKISEHGHTLNLTALSMIEIGRSKKADILDALGSPSFEGAFDKQKLYYLSQTMVEPVAGANTTKNRNIYIFSFNAKNVLQTIDLIDEKSGLNVVHITEKTRTTGVNLGVFDQIFSNLKRNQSSD
ncbi:outer membrane protein assembly factor BamE [Candidatus Puniceispirillum sp.]|nr:outer membrane protein assembly factor BamE [Candidatus Puniceispirillum sp.]